MDAALDSLECSVVQDENHPANEDDRVTFKDGDAPRTLHSPRTTYKFIRELGSGAFGSCFQATERRSRQDVAVKIVPKTKLASEAHIKKMISEVAIHRSLNHPHIVPFIESFEDDDNVYVVLELCANGTLSDVRSARRRFTEPEIRFWGLQLGRGLQYLHNERLVLHRDLKFANLMLDARMNLRIGDFGLAAELAHSGEERTTFAGTMNYMSPEVLQSKQGVKHSFKADIWSFAVILFTMVVGTPPFQGRDTKHTSHRILQEQLHFPPNSDHISDALKSLINACAHKEPERRFTIDEAIAHPFFTNYPMPRSIPLTALTGKPRLEYIEVDMPTQTPPRPPRNVLPPSSAPNPVRRMGSSTPADEPMAVYMPQSEGKQYLYSLKEETTQDGTTGENAQTPSLSRHRRASSSNLVSTFTRALSFGSRKASS